MVKKENRVQNVSSSVDKNKNESKLSDGFAALNNLMSSNESIEEDCAIADSLKAAQESHNAADNDRKAKVAESLEDDIGQLVGDLKVIIDKNKKLELVNKQKSERATQLESNAELLKKDVEQSKKELEKEIKDFTVQKKKLASDKADIAIRKESLQEAELDAEMGFSTKHMEMLEKFKLDKQDLLVKLEAQKKDKELKIEVSLTKLEEKKQKTEEEIDFLLHKRETLSESENTLLETKLKVIKSREDKLQQLEQKVQHAQVVAQRRLKQAELSEDDAETYKKELEKDVETKFIQKLSSMNNQNQNLHEQIVKYKNSEAEQLKQLSAYSELERQLNGLTGKELLEELSLLKKEKLELKDKLASKPSEQIQESYKATQQELREVTQRYQTSQVELQKTKTQLNMNRHSVVEIEQLEMQKRAIEKRNELLAARLDELSNEVDSLVNKQQSKSAFPALLKLDSKYKASAITETVPSLSAFAKDLQQRIAWDAKEQKELFYRIEDIHLFLAGLAMSRLHILQGISGTGKTSLAQAFSRAVGGGCKTVSVQAGWRDKGDLIGHFNAFEKKFYEEEALQGLYEAQCPQYQDRPYIILLDEMNLSRPEQYFAEFLSALELDPDKRILPLMTTGQAGGPEKLIDGRKIKIPENVWFIGTANHDETTFEFADKTYDRAHVMELPRHKHRFEIDRTLQQVTISFSSLESAFDAATVIHKKTVEKLVEDLDDSGLSLCLDEDFNVSWGNRLERHLHRFIPVMLECSSDLGFAVDHILATKVLRAGKATGRYDTSPEKIKSLIEELNDFWCTQASFKSKPTACLELLEKDLKRLGRN